MTHPDPGFDPDPDDDLDRGEPEEPQGRVLATGPGPLVVAGVIGLVLGWAIRPVCLRLDYPEPNVTLTSIAALFFVAATIGATAYLTRRTVRRNRHDLAHHAAVNRLVLGKAGALVGALALGGYVGYAVAQLGVSNPAADTRLLRSLLAALGSLAVMVTALLLEQACRVPKADK